MERPREFGGAEGGQKEAAEVSLPRELFRYFTLSEGRVYPRRAVRWSQDGGGWSR